VYYRTGIKQWRTQRQFLSVKMQDHVDSASTDGADSLLTVNFVGTRWSEALVPIRYQCDASRGCTKHTSQLWRSAHATYMRFFPYISPPPFSTRAISTPAFLTVPHIPLLLFQRSLCPQWDGLTVASLCVMLATVRSAHFGDKCPTQALSIASLHWQSKAMSCRPTVTNINCYRDANRTDSCRKSN